MRIIINLITSLMTASVSNIIYFQLPIYLFILFILLQLPRVLSITDAQQRGITCCLCGVSGWCPSFVSVLSLYHSSVVTTPGTTECQIVIIISSFVALTWTCFPHEIRYIICIELAVSQSVQVNIRSYS